MVCGRHIYEEWSSANIAPMIDRLTEIPEVRLSEYYPDFRDICLSREYAGRDTFGYRFHGRDNERDTKEEIADGVNYSLFGVLRRQRQEDETLDDMALMATFYAFKWFATVREIERRISGAP